MSFTDLDIKKEYRTPRDDIINDFYIPILKESILYQRSVGYFSSSSLIEISYGISKLVNNDGKIQLIASPNLSEEDIEAINKGYELRDNIIERALMKYITEPKNYFEEKRLNLLATLIAEEKLDIKIAYSQKRNNVGLYHEKMGIVYDSNSNIITFSGSMNETQNAFSNNYETIDVFTSWNEEDRVENKVEAFKRLWHNEENNAIVIDFPDVVKQQLLSYKRENVDYNIDEEEFPPKYLMDKIKALEKNTNSPEMPANMSLHPYQEQAIQNWSSNNYNGIFDMATGTGKTFTGLGAITNLYKHLRGRLATIIVCPYQHLVNQWVEDLIKFNIMPIIGHSAVKKDFKRQLKNSIMDYNLGVRDFFCFICTNATFATDYIQEELEALSGDMLLVVDEAHNFGSKNLSKTLNNNFNYRLALSATLERYGDEDGTNKLLAYFGKKCIVYSLEDAINNKFLTPYKYYPIPVYLSNYELEEYTNLTREIGKCVIKNKGKIKLNSYGEILAQKRSRIVAGAINKIPALLKYIKSYQEDNHILVYCGATKISEQNDEGEDIRQIDEITRLLGNDLKMKVSQFTSKEDNDKRTILRKKFGEGKDLQALVAIKCLDEGVNIPEIKTAFILASTTNPKEYIQRRGRVLRLSKGKEFAKIFDFVTLPRPLDTVQNLSKLEIQREKTLVKNEVTRIMEFKRLSLNPFESDTLIKDITEAYMLWEEDLNYKEESYE